MGYSWNEPEFSWTTDNSKVTAIRTCASDTAYVETETVNTAYEDVIPATSEAEGLGIYTAEQFVNSVFAQQTKAVIIPKNPDVKITSFCKYYSRIQDHIEKNSRYFSEILRIMQKRNGEYCMDKGGRQSDGYNIYQWQQHP